MFSKNIEFPVEIVNAAQITMYTFNVRFYFSEHIYFVRKKELPLSKRKNVRITRITAVR